MSDWRLLGSDWRTASPHPTERGIGGFRGREIDRDEMMMVDELLAVVG